MKKKILSVVALTLVLVLSLVSCGGTQLSMGTGGPAGTYYAFGGVLGRYIQNYAGVNCVPVSTGGSAANIQGIHTGNYQLGTVQSDVMAYAWNGTNSFASEGKVNSFRVIGGLYAEAVQLITTNPEIQSVADLEDKKVSIGAKGSGVYFNAMDVLNAAGIADKITPQYQSFDASVDSLIDNTIDAAFIVAGAPTPAVTQLMVSRSDARIIPIDGEIADTIMDSCPYYTEYVIPAGTYGASQTEDISTITVKATLIVSADLDEDTVYNITKAIFDNAEAIATEHAKGAELSLENATSGMTAPFHKGAARYFQEKGITVTAE